jgi:hypothetical protein
MGRNTEPKDIPGDTVRLPDGVVLDPPVSIDDLRADTEHDPEGAGEFVALIHTLRKEGERPLVF